MTPQNDSTKWLLPAPSSRSSAMPVRCSGGDMADAIMCMSAGRRQGVVSTMRLT